MSRWLGIRLDLLSSMTILVVAFISIPLVSLTGVVAMHKLNTLSDALLFMCRFKLRPSSLGSWADLHHFLVWNVSVLHQAEHRGGKHCKMMA